MHLILDKNVKEKENERVHLYATFNLYSTNMKTKMKMKSKYIAIRDLLFET